jgi:hypothetical protein
MEAQMRKYIGIGTIAAVIALGFVVWARSGVVTNADIVRSSAAVSPYDMMIGSKNLPVQHIENPM